MSQPDKPDFKLEAREIIEKICQIARKHGWAIGVHGSLERDIDLIAVPWTEEASGTWDLFEELRDTIGAAHSSARGDLRKPHGRQALMIIREGAVSYKGKNGMDDWNPPAIDMSFIDPRESFNKGREVQREIDCKAICPVCRRNVPMSIENLSYHKDGTNEKTGGYYLVKCDAQTIKEQKL